MKSIHPYDPETGAAAESGEWVNENAAEGVYGSIPPAEFFSEIGGELWNLITGQGITPDPNDLTQVAQAIRLMHQIPEDMTLHVPGDYATIQECLLALSTKTIPSTATVTINLGSGEHIIDTSTGMVVLHHPYGNRINIIGRPLNGNFPVYGDLNSVALTTEGALKAKFPTQIVVRGALRAGFYMRSGAWGTLENLLFIGDRTTDQHGLLVGEWLGEMGYGTFTMKQCWFHNFGNAGMRLNYFSAGQCYRVGSSHNAGAGALVVNMSAIHVLGGFVCAYNTLAGFQIGDNSFGEVIQGEGDFRNNGGAGIMVLGSSAFQSGQATAMRVKNNGQPGVYVTGGSYAVCKSLDGGGNNTTDVFAVAGSHVEMQTTVSATLSPSANTVGNSNSYINT